MLARSAPELPVGESWTYEAKWDGSAASPTVWDRLFSEGRRVGLPGNAAQPVTTSPNPTCPPPSTLATTVNGPMS